MNIKRRDFLGLAASAAVLPVGRAAFAAESGGSDPLVGKTWPGWSKGHFQLHAIHTGVSESMLLIYPDGTTMLLDCGDHPAVNRGKYAVPVLPNAERHAGEWIARYVRRVNPRKTHVDYMVTSHFHSDHTGCMQWHAGLRDFTPLSGFAQAAEWLTFGKAVDRGWPRYDDPIPFDDNEKYGSRELMVRLYHDLQKRDGLKVEKFRLGATDQFAPVYEPSACPGFEILNICANGKLVRKDGSVRDLYAARIARDRPQWLNENAMSLGMVLTYGRFRLFTAGDFSDGWKEPDGSEFQIEDALAEVVPPVDVAKINHHGWRSTTEKLAAALSPRVWISCVWDQLHQTKDTMERIERAYPGERLICPTVFSNDRRWENRDASWLKDIAEETRTGVHVVIDVPPGGETYSVTFLDAADEDMRVTGVRRFASRS